MAYIGVVGISILAAFSQPLQYSEVGASQKMWSPFLGLESRGSILGCPFLWKLPKRLLGFRDTSRKVLPIVIIFLFLQGLGTLV